VDAGAFEEAAAAARRGREPAAYRAALELYAGELLPEDGYEEWAHERREELRQLYLELLVEMSGICEEHGDYEAAVAALRRAVSEEPYREEAHRGLMRLFALSGRRQQALDQYRRLGETLNGELGAEPDAQSTRLHDAILAGGFPPHGPPGEHGAAGRVGARRHNLPAPLTSFVGRERGLVELRRALAMTRLLTLTGAGGAGKTRLALEAARGLVGAYPNGVWLAELAPLSDPTLVPRAVAAALDVRERPGLPLTAALADFLRSRCTLLVSTGSERSDPGSEGRRSSAPT
jgi:tetratricopeptide (TPR) repeat protein